MSTPHPDAAPIPTPHLPPRGYVAWAIQAVTTAGSGAVAFLGGSLIASASSGALNTPGVLHLLASAQLGLWLLLVSLLAAACVRAPAAVLAILVVVLAPVTTLVEMAAVGDGGLLAASPFGLVAFAWRAVGIAAAALVGAVVGVIARRYVEGRARRDAPASTASPTTSGSALDRRRMLLAGASAALLTAGGALILALPTQWLSIFFTIGGPAPAATEADGERYLRTAGFGVTALVLAVVAAVLRRGAGMIVLTALALACALIGAFVFQVPPGRFWPSDDVPAYNDDFPVCYGTTGNCPGG